MLFWWFVLAVFWFVVDDDGFLDYVQVLHQFSFVALNQQTASRINLEINAFAMPLSVLNDLAEAMKALDGKKGKNIKGVRIRPPRSASVGSSGTVVVARKLARLSLSAVTRSSFAVSWMGQAP